MKKVIFLQAGILCVALWLCGPAALNAQTPAPATALDTSKIVDTAARKAAEQLKPELDALASHEYTFEINSEMPATMGTSLMSIHKECAYRPPLNYFEKSIQVQKVDDKTYTMTIYIVFDGRTKWMYRKGELSPGATLEDFIPKSSVQNMDKLTDLLITPHIDKVDVSHLQQVTGQSPADYLRSLVMLPHDPFFQCDLASMLREVTPDDIVTLRATPTVNPGDAYEALRLTFTRADGLLQSRIYEYSRQNGSQTFHCSNYNLSPNLPANQFTFNPPAGVAVTDQTDTSIQGYLVFKSSEPKNSALHVQSDLRALATALEAYFIDNNHYPDKLPSLTTPIAYIVHIPEDPFNNGNLIKYKKLPGNDWIAWSVGPDGKDDGGKIVWDPKKNKLTDPGDIVRRKQ